MFNGIGFNQLDIVKDGLELYLDANDKYSYPGFGATWRDLSKSGYSGSLVNTPTYDTNSGGNILFDGINEHIRISNFIQDPDVMSVCIWGKVNDTTQNMFFGHRSEGTRLIQLGAQNNNELRYQLRGSGNVLREATSSINLYNWTYMSFVFNTNGTVYPLYVNGTQVSQITHSFGVETFTSTREYLGATYTTTEVALLGGNIAMFMKYNKELTATEILQNYNATKHRFGY